MGPSWGHGFRQVTKNEAHQLPAQAGHHRQREAARQGVCADRRRRPSARSPSLRNQDLALQVPPERQAREGHDRRLPGLHHQAGARPARGVARPRRARREPGQDQAVVGGRPQGGRVTRPDRPRLRAPLDRRDAVLSIAGLRRADRALARCLHRPGDRRHAACGRAARRRAGDHQGARRHAGDRRAHPRHRAADLQPCDPQPAGDDEPGAAAARRHRRAHRSNITGT